MLRRTPRRPPTYKRQRRPRPILTWPYGIQDAGGTFIAVRNATAAWVQPKAIPHGYRDAYSLAFLGFNNDFENGTGSTEPQIGTAANSIGGKTQYFAWYSPIRNQYCGDQSFCQLVHLPDSVRPGDHITTSISWRGNRATLTIADVRYHKGHAPSRWTKTVRAGLADPVNGPGGMSVGVSSWINKQSESQPLADFTSVRFTHVDVNGHVIGSYLPDNGTQYNNFGAVATLATSSPLDKAGDGFTVTWRRPGP